MHTFSGFGGQGRTYRVSDLLGGRHRPTTTRNIFHCRWGNAGIETTASPKIDSDLFAPKCTSTQIQRYQVPRVLYLSFLLGPSGMTLGYFDPERKEWSYFFDVASNLSLAHGEAFARVWLAPQHYCDTSLAGGPEVLGSWFGFGCRADMEHSMSIPVVLELYRHKRLKSRGLCLGPHGLLYHDFGVYV